MFDRMMMHLASDIGTWVPPFRRVLESESYIPCLADPSIHRRDYPLPGEVIMIPATWGLACAILASGVMITMSMTRLAASIAALTSVAASATAMLGNLAQQIRDTAGNEEASNRLADDVDASVNELSGAILENTPAAATEPAPEAIPAPTDTAAADANAAASEQPAPETPPIDESNQEAPPAE